MKVALISPYESIASYGVRIISATLKQQGRTTGIFFIPLPFEIEYSENLLNGLVNLLKNYDVVGISLSSNYFDRAVQLTRWLKKEGSWKIVWGGIHPTISPEECLAFADFVVMGEGEIVFPELIKAIEKGNGVEKIKGVAYCEKTPDGGTTIRKNPPMPPIQNLDEIPFPDYSFEEHYIWSGAPEGIGAQGDKETTFFPNKDELKDQTRDLWIPLTRELLLANTGGDYLTLSSRGCPHSCTFCCNNFLKRFYEGDKWFRKRSIDNLLLELHYIKKNHPYFMRIYYDDDAFMNRPLEELKLFSERIKKEIGLPFVITGVTPLSLTEEKLKTLLDGGLQWIRLGVQTISERVNKEIYCRQGNSKAIKNAVEIIRKYHKKMSPVWYDFIIDNPWETKKENLETLRFILDLPRPFSMCVYSLTYFPGTQLAQKALKEGVIRDLRTQVYKKSYKAYESSYVNNLFLFFTLSRLPRWILKLFINKWIIFSGFNYPLWWCYTCLRDWKARRLSRHSRKKVI